MKTINGHDYDAVIDGDDITFQGIGNDLFFEGGYKKILDEAAKEYDTIYSNPKHQAYTEWLKEEAVKDDIHRDWDDWCDWLVANVPYTIINQNLN